MVHVRDIVLFVAVTVAVAIIERKLRVKSPSIPPFTILKGAQRV